jgi:hypothetical protein
LALKDVPDALSLAEDQLALSGRGGCVQGIQYEGREQEQPKRLAVRLSFGLLSFVVPSRADTRGSFSSAGPFVCFPWIVLIASGSVLW